MEPLEEEPFPTEDELQALIAGHPELLDGEQIRPGDPRRWILITREKGISETSDSGARWAIDHLMVDQDAVPTLVEVKRGRNPEVRRAIVGQMLEYAAHAAHTWTAEELRRTFEASADAKGLDPDEELGQLLLADGEPDADGFWQNVATNLTARRLRLLFVADEIPDPLERVVEFLNAQMPDIEVLAVEIKQFRGSQAQTLVPRVIGRTAASTTHGPRRTLTRESFLDQFPSSESRNAAGRLLDVAQESGAVFEWGQRGGVSIRGRCSRWKEPITVAWLYSPAMRGGGWQKLKNFSFGAGNGEADFFDRLPHELRELLRRWADAFSDDDFTTDVSSKGVLAWSIEYEAAALEINLLTCRLSGVLSKLKSL